MRVIVSLFSIVLTALIDSILIVSKLAIFLEMKKMLSFELNLTAFAIEKKSKNFEI